MLSWVSHFFFLCKAAPTGTIAFRIWAATAWDVMGFKGLHRTQTGWEVEDAMEIHACFPDIIYSEMVNCHIY